MLNAAQMRPRPAAAVAVALDSGGFLALKRGAQLPSPEEICRLCREIGVDLCFAPDVPPPPGASPLEWWRIEIRNLARWLSAPCQLAPVVHVTQHVELIRAMLRRIAAVYDGVIGVGGAVPYITRHRYAVVEAALRAAEPHKIHLFGAGSPTVVRRLGLCNRVESVDWAGWTVKAAHGKVATPWGERHVTPRAVVTGGGRRRPSRSEAEWIAELAGELGVTLATFRERAIFNAAAALKTCA
jgi:queuine/archaeosine tRNA-ribosyltransferase